MYCVMYIGEISCQKVISLILAAILATMTQQGVARQLGVSQRIDARVAAGGHNNLKFAQNTVPCYMTTLLNVKTLIKAALVL